MENFLILTVSYFIFNQGNDHANTNTENNHEIFCII